MEYQIYNSAFGRPMKKTTFICPQCPWLYPVRVKNQRYSHPLVL